MWVTHRRHNLAAGVATDIGESHPPGDLLLAVTTDMEHSCGLRRPITPSSAGDAN